MIELAFMGLGGLAVLSAVAGLFFCRGTVSTSLWLGLCFAGLAGLLVLLDAATIGAALLLIQGGSTLVVLLASIVLVDDRSELAARERTPHRWLLLAGCAAALAVACVIVLGLSVDWGTSAALDEGAAQAGTHRPLGVPLFVDFLLPLLVTSLLLLAALVGVTVLTRRRAG